MPLKYLISGAQQNEEDDSHPIKMTDFRNEDAQLVDGINALQCFRDEVIEENNVRQLFLVSRMDGIEDVKHNILVNYKLKTANLNA